MGFFDNLKNFKQQIDQIESSVYSGKQSLLEVYERNAKLEAEIASRTKELERANKQMLTLQHIWDMMNSSKPLSSVLNAIVKSLQGELGYLHSCIVKKVEDSEGESLKILACSGEMFEEDFVKTFNCEPYDIRLRFTNFKELQDSINDETIYQSKNLYRTV